MADSLVPRDFGRHYFRSDFHFGGATSSYQIEGAAFEGGRGVGIWDQWTHRFPGRIDDGKNGYHAINSYNRIKEDVQLMKKMGLDAYRFSISWPRLLPTGRVCGGVNREGINYYNSLIDELEANGIERYVTLFHWDTPQALQDEYGGFLDKQIVNDFHGFVDLCFWEFGDRVKFWITFNEILMYSTLGYCVGTFPPGHGATIETKVRSLPTTGRFSSREKRLEQDKNFDYKITTGNPGTEPYIVTHNQLLCHADVVRLYRDKYQPYQNGKIGITVNGIWGEPLDRNNQTDMDASDRAMQFQVGWILGPVTKGEYPEIMKAKVGGRLPDFSLEETMLLRGSSDFIGINYYTSYYATPSDEVEDPPNYNTDSCVKLSPLRNGVPIGPRPGVDWIYFYPKGLYNFLTWIKKNYNSPDIYITENGYGENSDIAKTLPVCTNDQARIDYYQSHIWNVRKAIDAGVNVLGYFAWSIFDNFEWADGYTVRFGMVYVDYNKGLARNPKESAKWYRKFLSGAIPKKRDSSHLLDGPVNTKKK